MDNNFFPFPEELEHLSMINEKLTAALQEAEQNIQRQNESYMDTKRYMVEHSGDIDPHEMFQNEMLLKQVDRTGSFSVGVRDKLAKLKDSPYFARIDFQDQQSGESSAYYIGSYAFNYDTELLIIDWRAPIASMFYDYELGAAEYQAPVGKVTGELTQKRQFKIKGGVMKYALESSANVQDDVLQRELANPSDEKMKSIVSTIQKEQNQIIRNDRAHTQIIQGVAGSGKTSIALHRVAFLLYRFKDRLRAQNITILSPNKVFGDYISNVVPELGEEPIYQLGFDDLARIQLEGILNFEPEKDPFELDEEEGRRARYKSTLAFVHQLDRYIEQLADRIFVPEDYTFGQFTAPAQWIYQRFSAYSRHPIKKRLAMAADDILNRFETDNVMGRELPKISAVLKSLNAMLTMKNTLAIYKDFYRWLGEEKMFVLPEKKMLEWSDVYPFLYLQGVFAGLKESRITKHLVVDEMQDYTPIQYAVINKLFPCQKTILGDFGQSLNPHYRLHMEDLRCLYEEAEFLSLHKSYRSTFEIIEFAKGIMENSVIEVIERHGDEVEIIYCEDKSEQFAKMERRADHFTREEDRGSLGIICKTNADAQKLHEKLSKTCHVHLLSPDSGQFKKGVSVTSIQMAKGLEFDEVIIMDADQETYATDYDRSLLYIACTRAMHRLTLLHTGELSRLIVSGQEPCQHL